MFPPAKKTTHKNKSYAYAQGGSVYDDEGAYRRMKFEEGQAENRGQYPAMGGPSDESGRVFRNPFRSQESKTIDAIDDPVREGRNAERTADQSAYRQVRARGEFELDKALDKIKQEKKRADYIDTPPMARRIASERLGRK